MAQMEGVQEGQEIGALEVNQASSMALVTCKAVGQVWQSVTNHKEST